MTAGKLPMGRTARGETSQWNDDGSKRGVDVCYDDQLSSDRYLRMCTVNGIRTYRM